MVTAISEKFYNQNKQKFKKCPHLPLSDQIARSAINEKSTTLNMQIFCNFKINEF